MIAFDEDLLALHHNLELILGDIVQKLLEVVSKQNNITLHLANLSDACVLLQVDVNRQVTLGSSWEKVRAMAKRLLNGFNVLM